MGILRRKCPVCGKVMDRQLTPGGKIVFQCDHEFPAEVRSPLQPGKTNHDGTKGSNNDG
jgi:ssDNA-binding Zn-finger/Zn-ribbon topoisomerase 1